MEYKKIFIEEKRIVNEPKFEELCVAIFIERQHELERVDFVEKDRGRTISIKVSLEVVFR